MDMTENTTLHPSAAGSAFSDIEDIIADIGAGKMVIMVDDENRENEGDLMIAAEAVTPETINFMAMHARGLICLALTAEKVDALASTLLFPKHLKFHPH